MNELSDVNDIPWQIEIPQQQKEFFQKIQRELRQLQKLGSMVNQTLYDTPSKNEIIPYLEQKIDIEEARKLVQELNEQIQASRDAQQALKKDFSDKISQQQNQLFQLQRQSKQLMDFQGDYETMKKEINQLRRLGEETQTKAASNLTDYRSEQEYIHKTFTQLSSDVESMIKQVKIIEDNQKQLQAKTDMIRDNLVVNYEQINRNITEANLMIQKVVNEIPKTVQKAKSDLTAEISQIVIQEKQRRQLEQNYFIQIIKQIQDKLTSCDSTLKEQKTTLKNQIDQTEATVDIKLHEIRMSFKKMIDEHNTQIIRTQNELLNATNEQKLQVSKLTTFENTFKQADKQWKESVSQVQSNTEHYVHLLNDKINEQSGKIEGMLNKAVNEARESQEISQNMKNMWENDWRKRELLVDQQLIELKTLGDEVRLAAEGETQYRLAGEKEIELKIQEVNDYLEKRLNTKVDREEVQKALYMKVDAIE
ncbi:Conserved_hypothetical protein [Hexamita inflata]|uniref:Uncharacterized protein n=1 Tax=Hexamita inflata TaxID=28002 RepID=A0ABP1KS02_9EUKA